jgi:hypothetical protein
MVWWYHGASVAVAMPAIASNASIPKTLFMAQ